MQNKFLEIRNITKTYQHKDQSIIVLNNISFNVKKNEILAIVGESGSGKTTIAKIITNLIKAEKGEVRYKGEII